MHKHPISHTHAKRHIFFTGLVITGLLIFFAVSSGGQARAERTDKEIEVTPEISFTTIDYAVQKGDTLLEILQTEGGILYEDANTIIDRINEVHDVTKLQADQNISFISRDGELVFVRYDISSEEFINITFVGRIPVVAREEIAYEKKEAHTEGVITSSLYVDGLAAGLTDRMILELAGVFAWDVDFTSSIQEGDSFNLFYENLYRDGIFVGTGDIIAAEFTNNGETFYAYRVIDAEGDVKYFNQDGEAKKRLLLKTPLNYRRISSGFTTSRKHPILGDFRSHRAIDFAADTGTPVETVGDGTVTFAGTSGALGKYIKIQHAEGFVTAYAHLSKIYVKNGEQVKQGDLIGAVGTTGRSTGPHLHYEMYKNGNYVNALKVEVPRGEPITEELRPKLEEVVSSYTL